MHKMLIGGVAAILMLTGGLFLWQGISQSPDPVAKLAPLPDVGLPVAGGDAVGAPPPDAPRARDATREERRFARYDRNRDNVVTRVEMLSTRTNAFRRLDRDGNNLLSFEEWAVATSNRFAGADGNRDGRLSAEEFATTAPKRRAQSARCACDDRRSGDGSGDGE